MAHVRQCVTEPLDAIAQTETSRVRSICLGAYIVHAHTSLIQVHRVAVGHAMTGEGEVAKASPKLPLSRVGGTQVEGVVGTRERCGRKRRTFGYFLRTGMG